MAAQGSPSGAHTRSIGTNATKDVGVGGEITDLACTPRELPNRARASFCCSRGDSGLPELPARTAVLASQAVSHVGCHHRQRLRDAGTR